VLVISGRSCTGKDTVVRELIDKFGYTRATTYTTRPMREEEIEGDTYFYLSVEEFLKKYIDGFFLEVKYYTTKNGIWFYGSSIESYKNATENTVFILTPDGVRKLQDNSIKYKGILIDVSDEEVVNRQILRGDYSTPTKEAEAKRRFTYDKVDFKDVKHFYQFKIDEKNMTQNEIAELINKLDKESDKQYENI
jgi:guanylate kinase